MLQRVGGVVGVSAFMVVALAAPAVAKAPSPQPGTSASLIPNLGPSPTGSTMCTISDPQVTRISGLVVTADGYVVINDGNGERSREKLFFLDTDCALTRTVGYPGSSAFDPEDLEVTKDGTLWVADVGDNTTLTGGSGNRRSSIALWSLAPGANTPVIHRLAYPDGRARDAEALLIDSDGRPVIVTKDPAGEVYTLTEPLPANNANPAPLTRAGTFKPQATGTPNPYGIVGTGVVTGAAMSPDGKRAVIRTMSDAYEFDVADGDVVAAITTGTPRITPLPNEPQGEAIAYSRDGKTYLTVSDQPKPVGILRYVPHEPPAPSSAAPAPPPPAAPKSADRSFLDRLTLSDVTRIVIGIGVAGLLMIVIGVAAVIRSRRVRRRLLTGQVPAPVPGQLLPPTTPMPSSTLEPRSTPLPSATPLPPSTLAPAAAANQPRTVDGPRAAAPGQPPADDGTRVPQRPDVPGPGGNPETPEASGQEPQSSADDSNHPTAKPS
ncbi:hypothetical protein [Dactylosporangium sp. CA-092794]|uniref:hypothetical protein n=1 Tax=Dactylosporangium sp. CA-092794 TaxID=3239929 RepID=UPI003D8DD188